MVAYVVQKQRNALTNQSPTAALPLLLSMNRVVQKSSGVSLHCGANGRPVARHATLVKHLELAPSKLLQNAVAPHAFAISSRLRIAKQSHASKNASFPVGTNGVNAQLLVVGQFRHGSGKW